MSSVLTDQARDVLAADRPLLLQPLELRGIELRNRMVLSPMCTYSARDGMASDFHLVHLGKYGMGGFGLVFLEATAVAENGRITHGDLGLWGDHQIPGLRRIAAFLKEAGAVPAIQLAHAGRKASMQRPWFGNGPLDATDHERGDLPWPIVGAGPDPMDHGWLVPHELDTDELDELARQWAASARRALEAGFEVVEVHGAHGYLLHQFLSPLSNRRTDRHGGDLEGRMRFPLEVAAAVREAWPADRPVFFRVSATDGIDGGWTPDDSARLARALKDIGVDVVDVSSGGLTGPSTAARIPRSPGFQVPFAEKIRSEADIATMAVGLVLTPAQANDILESGAADLVAIGREALVDPHWALRAWRDLVPAPDDFHAWPVQYGWWLERRAHSLR